MEMEMEPCSGTGTGAGSGSGMGAGADVGAGHVLTAAEAAADASCDDAGDVVVRVTDIALLLPGGAPPLAVKFL